VLDVVASAAGNGITFTGGADNEIRSSAAFGRTWGIVAESSPRLVVAGSEFEGTFGGGLTVTGDFARIVRNRVFNRGREFPVTPGIELVGSQARIAENQVGGPWSRGGIVVSGASNAVLDNSVSGAAVPDVPGSSAIFGDGIFVGAFSSDTVLRRNVATGNEGDGIEVRASGTRLGQNAANDNGDLGIDAVAGVIDLGANTANGNGNPLQCRNVFCQ
jgi:parallel beta-helix repeat protein